jgi:hypothetical protein
MSASTTNPLTKVAEVTLLFWIIKTAATTLGETAGSYCQTWCFAPELGGDLVNCFYLDSIFEFHSSNYLRKVVEAA